MPFSLNQVAPIRPYSPLARIQLLNLALKRLSPPEKAAFNIIKLVILVPPFLLLAQLTPWLAVLGLISLLIAFSLLTRPLQIYFARNHWQQAIEEYERERAADAD